MAQRQVGTALLTPVIVSGNFTLHTLKGLAIVSALPIN